MTTRSQHPTRPEGKRVAKYSPGYHQPHSRPEVELTVTSIMLLQIHPTSPPLDVNGRQKIVWGREERCNDEVDVSKEADPPYPLSPLNSHASAWISPSTNSVQKITSATTIPKALTCPEGFMDGPTKEILHPSMKTAENERAVAQQGTKRRRHRRQNSLSSVEFESLLACLPRTRRRFYDKYVFS